MRYAVLADIHGNLPALEAVLGDAERQGVDSYLLLGDYCNHLSQTEEVLTVLRELPAVAAVRGNEDENLLNMRGQDPATWTDGQFRTIYWTYRQLSSESWAFLEALPLEQCLALDGVGVRCFHKSNLHFPGTVLDDIFCSTYAERYAAAPLSREAFLEESLTKIQGDEGLHSQLSALPEAVFLFAHSHVQYHAWVDGKLLLNPGSCGIHLDGDTRTPYTILTCEGGRAAVEERRVAYDHTEAVSIMKNAPVYGEASIWCEIVGEGLLHAREVTFSFLRHVARYAESIGDTIRPYTEETWSAAYESWRKE